MHPLILFLCGIFFLQIHNAFSVEIPEIVVLSSNQEEETSTVNNFEAIEKKNDAFISLENLLEKSSSINIRKSGGVGSNTSISIRGFDGRNINIYINGMLVSNGQDGFDLSLIPTSIIEKVEIFKNGAGVEFSNSNLGGAINLVTHQEDDALSYLTGLGSFGQKKVSASGHGLSLSYFKSENNFDYLNDNQTPFNPTDDVQEKRNNSALNQLNINYQKKDKKNELQYLGTLSKKEVPDKKNSPLVDSDLDESFHQASYKRELDDVFSANGLTQLSLSMLNHEQKYQDRKSVIGLGAQDNLLERSRYQFIIGHQHYFTSNQLIINANASKEEIDNLNQITSQRDQLERESLELAAEYIWNRTPYDASTFGVRRLEANDSNSFKDDERGFSSFWYKESYKREKYQLSGKYSRLEKLPTLLQLYADQGVMRGNSNLTNEKSENFFFDGLMRINKGQIALGLFFNKIEDAIVYVYDASGVGIPQNIAKASNYGAEFSLRYHVNKSFDFNFSAMLQDPRNNSDNVSFKNKLLPGIFKRSFSATLEYRYNRSLFSMEYRGNQQMFYDTANLLQALDQDLLNFSFTQKISARINLKLSLNNLLNKTYEEFNGYPTAGMNYFFSLFGRF